MTFFAGEDWTAADANTLESGISTLDGRTDSLEAILATGGEWASSGSYALNTGSNKLVFGVTSISPNGITLLSSNTWEIGATGHYQFWVQIRANAAVNGGVCIGATSYNDATHVLPFISFADGPDYGVSGRVRLTSGTQVCAYFYNNGANTSLNHGLRPAQARVWRVA
jgi:hypothetical protein